MRSRQLLFIVILLNALLVNCFSQEPTPAYRESKRSAGERAADLLKRMTLEEKVDQLAGGRRRARPIEDSEGKQIFENLANAHGSGGDQRTAGHELGNRPVVKLGIFDVMVGPSSADTSSVPLEVVN